MDFGSIPMEYVLLIMIIVFSIIFFALLWLYRGVPTMIMKANLFKKDLLMISLGNNRLILTAPKVVADWYYVKSGKKKAGIGGYWHITTDSTERFSGTTLSFANAHQAMTVPLPTTEVMSNLQRERLLGLRVNTYSDIDTIIKVGEALNEQEAAKNNKKKIKELPEELEIKYNNLIEQMRDLNHLQQLVDVQKDCDDKVPRILNIKDIKRLQELITQSKSDSELMKNISKDDLRLIAKAEGQLIRGQTSALRSIRGFLDGDLKIPHPKVIDNLVEDVVSKLQKAQEMLKNALIVVAILIGGGLAGGIIFMIVTGGLS